MLGFSLPTTENSFQIVCAVLALHNWNCWSGKQDATTQHPLFIACPNAFIE